MIKYYKGTVFNSGAEVLVNTVNCFGVMGSGIALEFKLRYPQMFYIYEEMCNKNEFKVGRPMIFKDSEISILNFPTKNHWRYPSKLEWIEEGLKYFICNYKRLGIKSIAFPKLGTNNGGLNWKEVKVIMERYLSTLDDIEIIICLDALPYAEGTERLMVNCINSFKIDELKKVVRLNKKQLESLKKSIPISRFYDISKLEGVGEKTYTNIFNFFYSNSLKKMKINCRYGQQLKLDI